MDTFRSTIHRAENAILDIAQNRYADCGVFSFGAVDINPAHLAVWITTATAVQRDALRCDPQFQADIRDALRQVGYPAGAIDDIALEIESQETIDRDHQGNWWYAVK